MLKVRNAQPKWATPPTESRLKLQIVYSDPRSSGASSIDTDQHRRSDTPLTSRTAHTTEGSSSSSWSLAGPGSGFFKESEDGDKAEVSVVPVPVFFVSGMKLLFVSNVTCSAGSLCSALLKTLRLLI